MAVENSHRLRLDTRTEAKVVFLTGGMNHDVVRDLVDSESVALGNQLPSMEMASCVQASVFFWLIRVCYETWIYRIKLTLIVIDPVLDVGSTDRPSFDHFEFVLWNECCAIARSANLGCPRIRSCRRVVAMEEKRMLERFLEAVLEID